jgi:hypothetical protein
MNLSFLFEYLYEENKDFIFSRIGILQKNIFVVLAFYNF